MPYITREDGERFIIPSYRDMLSVKKKNLLKREILLLASNYGEYAALQRKNVDQYEVAFSSDPGYLLGETVWHYFNRPRDLIYCEAIPNTAEAILVIVKGGSVYLDGSFPIDTIPEELVVFQTQQNSFEIYIHGNVPISPTPEEGKFSLHSSSVKSFNILKDPVFPTLPLVKAFQLQLIETVLESQGIGVFPIKKVLIGIVIMGLLWMGWTYVETHKKSLPIVISRTINPYQGYVNALMTPNPADEIYKLTQNISLLLTMPGWYPDSIKYSNGSMSAAVLSHGARTKVLLKWANQNHVQVNVSSSGFYLTLAWPVYNRAPPSQVYSIKEVIAALIDRLSFVIPGNNLKVGKFADKGKYTEVELTINFDNVSPTTFNLIGQQLRRLPLTLSDASFKFNAGYLSGSMVFRAFGD